MAEKQVVAVVEQDVAGLKARIEEWRRARGKLGPMPQELWAAAARLAQRRGVGLVARALGLDHGRLSKLSRVTGAEFDGSAVVPAPFVELAWTPLGSWACMVEMAREDGARMTIRLANPGPELSALTEVFWRAGR